MGIQLLLSAFDVHFSETNSPFDYSKCNCVCTLCDMGFMFFFLSFIYVESLLKNLVYTIFPILPFNYFKGNCTLLDVGLPVFNS